MRISTRTRYGIRLLFELGLNYGKGFILLKDIAEKQNISEKYLSKIVLLLKGAGFIRTERGSKGGYMLAKDPRNINMLETVSILEGDIYLIDCIKDKALCEIQYKCPTFDLWYGLNEQIIKYLSSITLQDLIDNYLKKIDSKYALYHI